jgi:hypothetical protein
MSRSALMAWPAAAAQPAETWKLVWADEFDRNGRPDPDNWTYETGFVRHQESRWPARERLG